LFSFATASIRSHSDAAIRSALFFGLSSRRFLDRSQSIGFGLFQLFSMLLNRVHERQDRRLQS
jgi:hypothetical protein